VHDCVSASQANWFGVVQSAGAALFVLQHPLPGPSMGWLGTK